MADEFQLPDSFAYSNPSTTGALGKRAIANAPQTITQNTADPRSAEGQVTVPFAAHAAIPVVGLTTLGLARFKNLEAAGGNFFTTGIVVAAAYYPTHRWNGQEAFSLRLEPGITHYWKADTADVAADMNVFDD